MRYIILTHFITFSMPNKQSLRMKYLAPDILNSSKSVNQTSDEDEEILKNKL